MQAIRAGAAYSLVLSLNNSILLSPDMDQALTEEAEDEDDG